jgi:hypothetical protein
MAFPRAQIPSLCRYLTGLVSSSESRIFFLVSNQPAGGEGFKLPKVPTIISYDEKDKKKFTWGEMKHKDGVVAGVKLLLDPDQPRPIYLPESTAKTDLRKLGKPAVEAVADFIGAMYKHAMAQIETQIPLDYLVLCQKKFILSVPAVWSDKAKDTTLKVRSSSWSLIRRD